MQAVPWMSIPPLPTRAPARRLPARITTHSLSDDIDPLPVAVVATAAWALVAQWAGSPSSAMAIGSPPTMGRASAIRAIADEPTAVEHVPVRLPNRTGGPERNGVARQRGFPNTARAHYPGPPRNTRFMVGPGGMLPATATGLTTTRETHDTTPFMNIPGGFISVTKSPLPVPPSPRVLLVPVLPAPPADGVLHSPIHRDDPAGGIGIRGIMGGRALGDASGGSTEPKVLTATAAATNGAGGGGSGIINSSSIIRALAV